jgi:hypothetical protein
MSINMIYVPNEVLSIVIGNVPYVVQAAHPNFAAVVAAAKSGDDEEIAKIPDLINIARAVATYTDGKITVDVDNGVILHNGEEVHNYICDRILSMMEEGFQIDPMVNFLENLMQNPSKRSVDELYGFLEFGKMPITPDGHFLAYKRVGRDYKSVYDGKTDNSIGSKPSMPRNKVNDNKDETCSEGLHFCSVGYLGSYSGEKIVVLKINPRDVVSIPTDYNNTKGRACLYEVVGELTVDQVTQAIGGDSVWNTSVVDEFDDTDFEDADRDFSDEDDENFNNDRYDDESSQEEYDEGIDMGKADYAIDPTTPEYVESNSTPFQDGYVDGWDTAETLSNIDPIITNSAISQTYETGYDIGYRAGRDKEVKDEISWTKSFADSDFSEGYNDGYKDGRGHKPRAVYVPSK